MPDETKIGSLKEGEGDTYLGVMEADEIMHNNMKSKVGKECLRRVRKAAQPKLNARKQIKATNTWAVTPKKGSAVLTLNGGFHPGDCRVARLYLPRREGGSGLISWGNCVNQA